MGFAVVHMQKIKAGGVRGIQSHNNREHPPKTNPDIRPDKTADNYDLVSERNYSRKIKQTIKSQATETKTVRKDAVVLCNFIVTSDEQTMRNLGADRQRAFFEKSLAWFADRYGADNIVNATVHMDETTPHLHIGLVPIKNKRLSAKNLFARQELQAIQSDFAAQVGAEFGLERGKEGSERKHLSEQQLKLKTAEKELAAVQAKIEKLNRQLEQKHKSLNSLITASTKIHKQAMAEEKRVYSYHAEQEEPAVKSLPGGNVVVKKDHFKELLEIAKIYAANYSTFQNLTYKENEIASSFARTKQLEHKAFELWNKQANLSVDYRKLLEENISLRESNKKSFSDLKRTKALLKDAQQQMNDFKGLEELRGYEVKTIGKAVKCLLNDENLTERQKGLLKGIVHYAGCDQEPAEIGGVLAGMIPKTEKQLRAQYKRVCMKLEDICPLEERMNLLEEKRKLEKTLKIEPNPPQETIKRKPRGHDKSR
ncbi:MAG: MobV family relaxase [Anaerobutyricum hallii]